MRRVIASVAMGVVASSASSEVSAQAKTTCEPSTAKSLPDASTFDPGRLVGHYTLTLVATAGSRSGQRTEGATVLVRSTPADRGKASDGSVAVPSPMMDRVQPLYGWADISLSDIAAISERDPRSRDPMYPGVMVRVFPPVESNPTDPRIHILLGGGTRDSSQAMVQIMESPITVLRAVTVDSLGMTGTWASGSLGHAGDGYFCLRRTSR